MGKFTATQNNFSSGELSKTLEGRTDLQQYANGVSHLENFIPLKDGGVTRRPGSWFVPGQTVNHDSYNGTMVPFLNSDEYNYLIFLWFDSGTSTIHTGVHEQQLYWLLAGINSPYSIVESMPTAFKDLMVLYNATFADFNHAQVFDSLIFTHKQGKIPPFVIQKDALTANQFLMKPYYEAAIDDGAEGRAVAFPSYSDFVSNLSQVYINTGVAPITLQFQDSGGSPSSFWFGVTGDLRIGDYIKINDKASPSKDSIYRITGYVSANTCEVEHVVGPNVTITTNRWTYGAWSYEYGYPRTVSTYQQRVCFGGTVASPSTIWFSNIGNLFLIMPEKLEQDKGAASDVSGLSFYGDDIASDPFTVTIASDTAVEITWMNSDRVLQVGTYSAEYVVSTVDGLFDREHADVTAQTFYGGSNVQPVRVQSEVVFTSRDGKQIRGNKYSFQNGGNTSRLLSVLSKDMVYHNFDESVIYGREKQAFTKMVYDATRGAMWLLTSSGSLVVCVVEESSGTLAWSRQTLGGENVTVKDIAIMPDASNNYDVVYLLVERDLNGTAANVIEAIRTDHNTTKLRNIAETPNFLDCCVVTYNITAEASPTTKYDEFVNTEMGVFEMGVDRGDFTMEYFDAFSVTIPLGTPSEQTPISVYDYRAVGFRYESKIVSMLIKTGSRTGDPNIQFSRVDSLAVNAYNSKEFEIGTLEDHLEKYELVEDGSEELYTGLKKIPISSSGELEQRFIIKTDRAYPLTILSVGVRGVTQD